MSLEVLLLIFVAVAGAGAFFTFYNRLSSTALSSAEQSVIYPELPPTLVSLECYTDYGKAELLTDKKLEGTVNYEVRQLNGTIAKQGTLTFNFTDYDTVYFGAPMEWGKQYRIRFYTPSWSLVDTCTSKVNEDVMLYLPFDGESAKDNSPQRYATKFYGANDGTIYGASWVSRNTGYALNFDGVNDYAIVSRSTDLEPENLTISLYLKLKEYQDDWVLDKSSDDYVYGYLIRTDWPSNTVIVFVGNGTTYMNGGATLPLNTWIHVVATYDGNYLNLYLNGTLKNSIAFQGPIAYDSSDLYFGSRNGNDLWLNGSIDDVRIYDRALNSTEVLWLYQGNDIRDGLTSYWDFDEGEGNIAHDTHMWATGKRGGAMYLDGEDDYLNISASFEGKTTFCVYEWWYPQEYSSTGSFSYSVFKSGYPSTYDFSLGPDWGKVTFMVRGNDGYLNYASVPSPEFQNQQNSWHHLVGCVNDTTVLLYIDGERRSSFSDSSVGKEMLAKYVQVGKSNSGPYFKGLVDELVVYNRVLSSEEISAIYQAYN